VGQREQRRPGSTTTATGASICSFAGYWPDDVNLWQLTTTRIMPESFEYAANGGRKYLLHNTGNGRFEDVTTAMGIDSRRWTLAVVAADLLGTGYPDLFFANDYGVSELYANQGGKRFVDVAETAGVGRTPKSGMNASLGDVFNDGRPGIYKSNISEPGVLVQGNDLWVLDRRKGGGEDGVPTFENVASGLGIELGGWSWGAQFGDFNNDGTQDLYVVNGYVSAGERGSYWYDFSVIAVGPQHDHRRREKLAGMKGRSLSGFQRKRLWLNDGLGTFTEVAQVTGITDAYDGRAVALADFGNRGALDAVVANQRGPLLLYRNTGRSRPATGWTSSWRARAATAAPSAPASRCTGAASSSARTWWRPAASARRTSAACTSASARPARSSGWSSRGRRVRRTP
jgi:hypothetical protein